MLVGTLILGLFLRLWNINFGLPHSWYADEPEIGELAIKYTYELKNILTNNDVYKLIPENYVYGTFPVYFYTVAVIVFNKLMNLANVSFTKTDLYIFMRVINALISAAIIPIFLLLLKRTGIAKQRSLVLIGTLLIALNWKLIVHAHYLNHDIVITLLILIANYFFYKYLQHRCASNTAESDTLNTILFSISFGLAVSTKITVLLTFPIYLAFFLKNKDFRNLFASIFIVIGAFIVTNPFSWIFISDFAERIFSMRIKEAGMVFDSVDYSPFKYIKALTWITTLPIFLLSIAGVAKSFKEKTNPLKQFTLVMFLQILFYLVFFSLQSRRVDRWMLPIIPNIIMFSVIGLSTLFNTLKERKVKFVCGAALGILAVYYLYFPALLLSQFQRNTPKSAAYIWARENLPETSTKFGLTEEGLDPLNKLSLSTIWQYNVYESKGAQFVYPPDARLYDYIILSSRPAEWTKNPEVVKKYPYYANKWSDFINVVSNSNIKEFKLIKSFELAKPNLIPLSNVYIYQKVSY